LTTIPFALVMRGMLSHQATIIAISSAAIIQILVHLYFFLHMDTLSRARWNEPPLIVRMHGLVGFITPVDAFPPARALQSVRGFSPWCPVPGKKQKNHAQMLTTPYNQNVTVDLRLISPHLLPSRDVIGASLVVIVQNA